MAEYVVVGRGHFSRKLADELDASYVGVKLKRFADNEIKPTIMLKRDEGLEEKSVIVVSRTNRYDPRPDDAIIELGFNVKNIASRGAEKIDIVMPWFFYSRQNRTYQPGESASLSFVADLYEKWMNSDKCPIENIVTVNSHIYCKDHPLNEFFSDIKSGIKVHDLSSTGLLADYLRTKGLDAIISPGAGEIAKELSGVLEIPYENLKKHRDHRTSKIKMEPPKMDLKRKDTIILDDLSASGDTILKACDLAFKAGANVKYIALPHLMANAGIKNICKYADSSNIRVVTTDSMDSNSPMRYVDKSHKDRYVELSIVPMISSCIKRL